MNQLLKNSINELKELLKQHKVKRAYAFGSVCSDNFKEDSDIDLLVKFEDNMTPEDYSDNYFNLLFNLQNYFQRKIDLVSESSLTNPYLINSINRSKQLIYD